MPAAVRCRAGPCRDVPVRCHAVLSALLLVLCVGSRCGAVQVNTSLGGAWSRPAELLGQAAEAALLTLTSEVEGRLDAIQAQLDTVQAESSAAVRLPRDCSDLPAGTPSEVHLLQPGLGPSQPPVAAFCDLKTHGGGWTVIQRRADIKPRQEFFLGWQAYKEGFGELDAELWWGLEHLWLMTSSRDRQYELRFDLADFEGGERHAVYQGFRVSSETEGYRLRAVNYTGDAGDSVGGHSGRKFSTFDREQDTHVKVNCARNHKAGWWYSACHASNLNGPYLAGQHSSYADGVNWQAWKGYHYSLKTVTMKIRPTKKFLQRTVV